MRARRGFTLIELVLVVGIIGLLTAMIVGKITQQKTRLRIDQVALDFQLRLNKARALAEAAGSRIGTNRLQNCGVATDQVVAVRVDLGQESYQVPEEITLDPATDVMTTVCRTYRFADELPDPVDLIATGFGPSQIVSFSFLPSGRLQTGGAPTSLRFELRGVDNPADRYGVRVLPSGIVCTNQDPAVACDGDRP